MRWKNKVQEGGKVNLIKELIKYLKTGDSVKCPKCGEKLHFEKMFIGRGSINVSCEKCGIFEHYDGNFVKNGDAK